MLTALILAAAAAAAPSLDTAIGGRLSAAGTEPFWGLDFVPGMNAMFNEPDEDGILYTPLVEPVFDPSPDGGYNFRGYGYSGTITPGPCSDGMSDAVFPYAVTLKLLVPPARSLKGCAYRSWGQDVVAAMPVIDACYAAAKFPQASPEDLVPPVVYAAADGPKDGYVLFAGQTDEIRFQECAVKGGTAFVAPFKGEAGPPGTEREIFVRKTGAKDQMQPGGMCYDAEEVKSEAGEVLGWWMDPMGC